LETPSGKFRLVSLLLGQIGVIIVDFVSFGKRALVQDARNQNPAGGIAIIHNMAAALHSAQTWADVITASTRSRISSQHLATLFKFADVTNGLLFAPRPKRISADPQQVGLGTSRETRTSHLSAAF
jgi:hypothetical protein